MSLTTFSGTAIPALLAQVQQELGDDAVIVSTRSIRRDDGSTAFEILAQSSHRTSRSSDERVRQGRDAAERTDAGRARRRDGSLRIALLGPTGGGKTTTLAKLAGHPRIYGNRAVGMLSLDTYRIGAVEQLRTYAELLSVPLAFVYTPQDIDDALAQLGSLDVVLIDTPGRGPRTTGDREAVDECIRILQPSEVHLVLPVGMERAVCEWHVDHFCERGATHLLATKLDEMPAHRVLFDLAIEHDMSMRWVTNGHEVPRDIRAAGSRLLLSLSGRDRVRPLAEVT